MTDSEIKSINQLTNEEVLERVGGFVPSKQWQKDALNNPRTLDETRLLIMASVEPIEALVKFYV